MSKIMAHEGKEIHEDVEIQATPGTINESAEKPVRGRVLVPHPTLDPNDPLVSRIHQDTYLVM